MSAQITSTEGELLVVNPKHRSIEQSVLGLAVSLFFLWVGSKLLALLGMELHGLIDTHHDLEDVLLDLAFLSLTGLALLGVLGISLNALRPLFAGRQRMRCTRGELELTSVDFGRVWRERVFAREQVGAVTFGTISVSRNGAVLGLLFRINNKQVKALPTLKAREAQQILVDMRRLGFDVLTDPATNMAMEIAIEMEELRSRLRGSPG